MTMRMPNGLGWMAVAQVVKVLSQLLSLAILSRILSPSDFGLVAMANVLLNLAMYLKDFGVGSSVIQRVNVDSRFLMAVLVIALTVSLLLYFLIYFVSDYAAIYFSRPELSEILPIMALVLPVSTVGVVFQMIMERGARFRDVALIEVFASVSGIALVVLLATLGFSYFSIVIQSVYVACVCSLMHVICARGNVKLSGFYGELAGVVRFGGGVTVSSICNFLSRNIDALLIGKYLGGASLGVYSQAYRLMLFPIQNVSQIFSRALFPSLCRLQGDSVAFNKAYFSSFGMIGYIVFPIMFGMWFVREELVYVVLGPGWGQVPDLLIFLAPIGVVQALVSSTSVVFLSLGKTEILARLAIIGATLNAIAFVVGVQSGLVAAVCLYFVSSIINAVPCFMVLCKIMGLRAKDVLVPLVYPLLFSMLMVFVLMAYSLSWGSGLQPVALLVSEVIIGGAVYLGLYLYKNGFSLPW